MTKRTEAPIPAGQNQKIFTIENEQLYTTNEVARICRIGRSTLLRMEECGYDKARYIDPSNGYRYYDVVNIHKIMMYQMLQKMGLTVTEISAYYRHELEPDIFLEDLHARLEIARRCVDEFEARFSERESRQFSYTTLPDVTCYCFPCDIRSPKNQIEYNYKKLQEIYNAGYKPFPTTPMFSITPDIGTIYDEESFHSDHSIICSAIYPDENLPMENVVHFESRTAFSLLYHGNTTEIMNTGGRLLLDEMKKRNLTPAGPLYGICVVGPFFGTDIDPRDYVFRWAIPI